MYLLAILEKILVQLPELERLGSQVYEDRSHLL